MKTCSEVKPAEPVRPVPTSLGLTLPSPGALLTWSEGCPLSGWSWGAEVMGAHCWASGGSSDATSQVGISGRWTPRSIWGKSLLLNGSAGDYHAGVWGCAPCSEARSPPLSPSAPPPPHPLSLQPGTRARQAGCLGRPELWFPELQKRKGRALSQGTLEGLGILPALPGRDHSSHLAFSLHPPPPAS